MAVKYHRLPDRNEPRTKQYFWIDWRVFIPSLCIYTTLLSLIHLLPYGEYHSKNVTQGVSDGAILLFVTVVIQSITDSQLYLLPGMFLAPIALYSMSFFDSFHVSITPSSIPSWKPEVIIVMSTLLLVEACCVLYYICGTASIIPRFIVLLVPLAFVISSVVCLFTSSTCTFHFHHASLGMLMLWISQLRRAKMAAFLRGFFLGVFLHAIGSFNNAGVVTSMFRPF